MQTTREEIRQILAINLCIEIEDCKDDANLYYDLDADSLSLLSFSVELQDLYGQISTSVRDQILSPNVYTVKQLLDKIEELCQSKNK